MFYSLLRRRQQLGYATKLSQVEAILRDNRMRVEQLRAKHLINGTLLNRTPRSMWMAFSTFDHAFERTFPSLGWDVFVLAAKSPSGKFMKEHNSG